LPMQIR